MGLWHVVQSGGSNQEARESPEDKGFGRRLAAHLRASVDPLRILKRFGHMSHKEHISEYNQWYEQQTKAASTVQTKWRERIEAKRAEEVAEADITLYF